MAEHYPSTERLQVALAAPSSSSTVRSTVPLTRLLVCILMLAAGPGILTACKSTAGGKKDAVCKDRGKLARAALKRNDLDDARRLLDDARERCGEVWSEELDAIAREVSERAERVEGPQHPTEPKRDAGRTALDVERFVRWATNRGDAVTTNFDNLQCAERGSADFGFCEATHPNAPNMRVRFFKDEKDVFRYQLSTENPISCQDLGPHRKVQQWSEDDSTLELCELVDRELRNVSALLVNDQNKNKMFLFSDKYALRDQDFSTYARQSP